MASDSDGDPWADWDDYYFEPDELERQKIRELRKRHNDRVSEVALGALALHMKTNLAVDTCVLIVNKIFAEAERTVVVK